MSYNTNGFEHDNDKAIGGIDGQIVNFIKNENTDVFCIQEFSAIKYKYFNNYPNYFKTNIIAGKGKSVMAIFSKYPIKDKGYIDFPNSRNGAMYVDLIFNKKLVRIYNLHLESYGARTVYQWDNSKNYSPLIKRIGEVEKMRKEQVEIVIKHMDNFNGKVIICGDFNSTQFSSSYRILKNSRKDTFIEAGFGFGKTYELFKYPFRLDYILVDDGFEVLSHQNFDLKLSDHEPIIARVIIN
jgi:endonuclease/exonuclease/phosphatase family metal-dependent hydrolase